MGIDVNNCLINWFSEIYEIFNKKNIFYGSLFANFIIGKVRVISYTSLVPSLFF